MLAAQGLEEDGQTTEPVCPLHGDPGPVRYLRQARCPCRLNVLRSSSLTERFRLCAVTSRWCDDGAFLGQYIDRTTSPPRIMKEPAHDQVEAHGDEHGTENRENERRRAARVGCSPFPEDRESSPEHAERDEERIGCSQ